MNDYIVRLERKKDGRHYFIRHDGCTTARIESSMMLDSKTAKQLAKAITTQHRDFKAVAVRYVKPDRKHKKEK